MNNVYSMEGCNLFCGDHDPSASNHLVLQEMKLPALEENYVDHAAGGAPVAIEIDTHVNRLEATFNLAGWNPWVMTLIGESRRERQVFTSYGLIRDRRLGEAIDAMAVIQGRLGRASPTAFSHGALMAHEFSIRAIVHYELYMGGEEIYWWDFFTSTRRIGGADLNFDFNRILRIPVSV
jgi:phage tail tube protein FII